MWVYHTSVRPRRAKVENADHRREMDLAYNKFLTSIFNSINETEIPKNGNYCFTISTKGDDDAVDPESKYHVKFTKSGFLRSYKLQRDLIQKFKPMGIYVANPQQKPENWVIEFSFFHNKVKSNKPRHRETTHSEQS